MNAIGWKEKRLRYFIDRSLGDDRKKQIATAEEVSFLPMESIGDNGTLDLSIVKQIEEVEDGYTLLFDGDVVVAKITPCFENGKGALINGLINGAGYGTTELHVLTPNKEIDSQFLYYVTASNQFRRLGEAQMKGAAGQKRVPGDFILNYRVSYPPMSEQKTIATRLNEEMSKIDLLINAKRRLVQLLGEKRRALITQAVTKGLNPDAPMKESGIEWLGKIPRHWKIMHLKFLSSEPLMYGANEAGLEEDPNYPRFIRITDIDENGLLRKDTFKSLPIDKAAPFLLKVGDVLLARSGATVGKAFLYKQEWGKACFAGYLIRFRCNTLLLNPDFLFTYSQSEPYWTQINMLLIQATIQNFSAEKYGNLIIPVPEVKEQNFIIDHISNRLAYFDTLRDATLKTISLLHERRNALIEAAVTGNITIKG